MIKVSGPDGSTIEFPDETSMDVIKGVMAKHYGAPQSEAAPAVDKYKQAAEKEYAREKSAGLTGGFFEGLKNKVLQGATFGGADEIMAGVAALKGITQPMGYAERYKYEKALQDVRRENAEKDTGAAGTVAELASGIGSGGAIASSGKTLLRAGQSLLQRTGALAGEGAAYGGVSGALGEDGSLADRGASAAKGAALGASIGGALPAVGRGLQLAASPIVSNVAARIDPEGAARSRLARAITESGRTPEQVSQAIADADAAGQGVFTVADALGNPGQRLLSTVSRAPGEGRTAAVEFLNARQSGQASRVGSAIDEALGAGQTARQASAARLQEARNAARPLYEDANEYPIQWNDRLEQFIQDPVSQGALRRGIDIQRLESLANNPSHNPRDFTFAGYNEASSAPGVLSAGPNMRTLDALKKGLDDMLEGYRDKTTGRLQLDEHGRAIDQVRRALLTELDAVNPLYRQARQSYAGPAAEREAIGLGQNAATRGRAADNLDTFNRLGEGPQQGFRAGYADKLNETLERGAEGVNAARRFTSGKYSSELPEMSLFQGPIQPGGQDELSRRLGREMQMFETRRQATGGSQTADNLADEAAAQIDPRVIVNLLHGNILQAGGQALRGTGNVLGGNTPEVRNQLAKLLLQSGPGVDVGGMIAGPQASAAARARLVEMLSRGVVTGSGEYAGQNR